MKQGDTLNCEEKHNCDAMDPKNYENDQDIASPGSLSETKPEKNGRPPINASLNLRNMMSQVTRDQTKNEHFVGNNVSEDSKKAQAKNSFTQGENEDLIMPFSTLADLKMQNLDKRIDPNFKAPFIHSPPQSLSPPESPETKRKRIEENARFNERLGRLHPVNKHLNQGPVINPPLISPATMVGFSPAGQRYEIDMNTERPTRFNSEFDRRMHDDAMRHNVRKMMNELSEGCYLPPSLDANIEKQYHQEVQMIKEEATKYFEQRAVDLNDEEWEDMTESEDEQHLSLLKAEEKFLEIVGHAELKLADFPEQMSIMLKNALQLELSPVMLKKNPIILEVLDKLSRSTNPGIKYPATTLLCKAKALFNVPPGRTFKEHYLAELEIFKKKTDHMSPFQLMMITDEPDDGSEGLENEDGVVSAACSMREDFQPEATEITNSNNSSTKDIEPVWIPVDDVDSYSIPINTDSDDDSTTHDHDDTQRRREHHFRRGSSELETEDDDDARFVNLDEIDEMEIVAILNNLLESEVESEDESLDSELEEELEFFSLMERIHGMLHNGVHGFIVLHSFQFI